MRAPVFKAILMDGRPRCQKQVPTPGTSYFQHHQCTRAATEGERCAQHGQTRQDEIWARKEARYKLEDEAKRFMQYGKRFYQTLLAISKGKDDGAKMAQAALDRFDDRPK